VTHKIAIIDLIDRPDKFVLHSTQLLIAKFISEADILITWKNVIVDPPFNVPYLISLCFERSSAFSIGDFIRSTVRKAARLAV